ncbi:calcium permeable stress-gated cation channel [Geosmithia morbida]|uniref:Calcium permeable stress-gated cation channel n=1 Tax=Geosmithia morbida TaxID=1094350 RepID=A0A9P4YV30_9HYPO|nr:calcium permeable stress-gated cation channel [Geosmithia morbida]KAF4122334.1 calcium permeable stress-gated cation channel [Geosmithia morbida]
MTVDAASASVLLDPREGIDAGKKLLNLLKNPFADQLAGASLLSALITSLSFTVLATVFFSLLRPHHQALYAPKLKHADEKHAPPPIGKSPWAWLNPLWSTSEEDLITQIGMDATVFLRFVRMCRNIFLILSLIYVCVIVPVNITHYSKDVAPKDTNWFSTITPEYVWGKANWAQVVVSWLMDLSIVLVLWWNYRKITKLRRAYFESDEYQDSLHARTLMLWDIPRQMRSDEGIARIIDEVVPNSSFARTVVARDVKDLPRIISDHDHAVRKLEKILAKYLKNPQQLPPGRPTCKPSKKDRAYDTYPRNQRVDAIEYYTQRIRSLELEIKEARANVDRRGIMPYGFASYDDISEAHNIAYACRSKKPHSTTVKLAPRPNDLIWTNMPLSKGARSRKSWLNFMWTTLLTILWIAPNAMIAIFLVNLSNLGNFWPDFQRSLSANTTVWGIVQGILSPSVMSLVYLVLPTIFRRLAIRAGDKTKTGRERHVLSRLYNFFIFNNLIVFTLFSVIWTFVAGVVDSTSKGRDGWEAIKKQDISEGVFISLCRNSLFWVTYLLQRQLGAAVDLAQLYPLLEAFFIKKFSSPTPRELIEMTAPPPFEYASYYNYFLFYATVALCYASIQPLVLPATALYFVIDAYLKKYLILYRFVTKTESGGVFWRVLFNRFIFATVLSNLVVLLILWNRGDGTMYQFYSVCPLPFLMIGFKIYCRKVFDAKIRYYSTRNVGKHPEAGAQKEDRQRSDRLASRFGHPSLYQKLITPMVHQKAQNLLPAIYTGRLTDGRDGGDDELMSVSGYSDVYAMKNMNGGGGGRPGKPANSNMPGFEYVSESHMDFEYYKNRAEFAEDHGGGEIFGRPGEIIRTDTPGTASEFGFGSRAGTPLSGGRSVPTPFSPGAADMSYQGARGVPNRGFTPPVPPLGNVDRTFNHSPLYAQDNGSTSNLVSNAQPLGMAPLGGESLAPSRTPSPMAPMNRHPTPVRSHSPGPSVGAMGGGPSGYSGLAQAEYPIEGGDDATQYNYFRSGARGGRRPGEGR